MLDELLDNIPLFLSAFFCIYFVITILSKKYVYNILDPISTTNIFISISLTDLFFLYIQKYVIFEEFLRIFCIAFAFYVGIFTLSFFYKKRAMAKSMQDLANNFSKIDLRLIYFSAICVIILTAYFSVQMIIGAGIADERILLAKNNRFLDVLKNGLGTYFLGGSFMYLTLTNKKSYLPLILTVYAFISFFSGSKSFLSSFVLMYAFFSGVKASCNPKFSKSRMKRFFTTVGGIAVVVVSAFLVLLSWRGDAYIAFYAILSRILLNTGDVYIYSYVFGDYQTLYGKFDFFGYLFHPFLKMIGFQGYEFPLGAELYGLAGREIEGYGPNPHLPTLLLVLTQGNFVISLILSLLLGILYSGMIWAISEVVLSKKVNNTIKIYALSQYYGSLQLLYFDIGMFEVSLISAMIGLLLLLFIRKFLYPPNTVLGNS